MIEREFWHPVSTASAVTDQPVPVRLLQHDLVLWRNGAGTVQAWSDQCPHRGARLSLGRISDDQLECAYHGWRFDSNAQLKKIPALPDFVAPPTHRAEAFQVREQYDLIWVRLDSAGGGRATPAFEAEAEARLRKLTVGPYDVNTSAARIVENFLDLAHFPFVHEHWLGARDVPGIADYQIESTVTGFIASGCRAWQPQSSIHAKSGAMVDYTYEVNAPFTAILTKIPDQKSIEISDFHESIALFICPVEPEFSRVWFRLAMNDFNSPDSDLQAFQETIFGQDKPILESQRPKLLPLNPKAELHCAADKSSAAYRRALREWDIRFGVIHG